MATNVSDCKEKYLTACLEYEIVVEALHILENIPVKGDIIDHLRSDKVKLKDLASSLESEVLKLMPLSKNVMELSDINWYAIRYLDDQGNLSIRIKIALLDPKSTDTLLRDGRHEKELTPRDLEKLLPSVVDSSAMDNWDRERYDRAHGVIQDLLPDQETRQDEKLIRVHAVNRYIERVKGITNIYKRDVYRTENLEDIKQTIRESVNNSELLWEDDDGVRYWIDEFNNVYVEESSDCIVTMYNMDFGFTAELNRHIANEQVKVMKKARDAWEATVDRCEHEIETLTNDVKGTDEAIEALQDQIDTLENEKKIMTATIAKLQSEEKQAKSKFNVEHGKLFRRRTE
jgi:archaellum component FlaC